MSKTESVQHLQEDLSVPEAAEFTSNEHLDGAPYPTMDGDPSREWGGDFNRLLEAYEQLQAETRRLTLVNEMIIALNQATHVDDIFKVAAVQTRRIFGSERVSVTLLNSAGNRFQVFALDGAKGAMRIGTEISLEEDTSIAQAIREEAAIVTADLRTNPSPTNAKLSEQGIRSTIVTPLIVGGQVIGTLNIGSKHINAFGSTEERLVLQMASQIATVVQNQRLLEQTQQRAGQLEETTQFLNSIIDSIPIGIFVKEAKNLTFVGWNRANEALIGLSKQDVIGKSDYDFFPKEADNFVKADREILLKGEPVDIPEEEISTSHKGVRLLHTTKVPIFDTDGEAQYLLGISEDITQREELLAEAEGQAGRLAQLNEMSQHLSQVESEEEVFHTAARYVAYIFAGSRGSVTLLDETGNQLRVLALKGNAAIPVGVNIPVESTMVGKAVRENRLIISSDFNQGDLLNYVDLQKLFEQGLRCCINAPFVVEGKVIGSINVATETINGYTVRDESLMRQIASLLSSTLENKRLLQQTRIRARREQILREVTARIRSGADVDTIMRTAAQEIGQVLGRPAYVQLNQDNSRPEKQSTLEEKDA